MGPGADDYDDELIFTHLVFYMDKVSNAARNGLAKSSPPDEAMQR